jgi:superfamily II DNA helicase RecQ
MAATSKENRNEQSQILANLRQQKGPDIKLLYITPEKLVKSHQTVIFF